MSNNHRVSIGYDRNYIKYNVLSPVYLDYVTATPSLLIAGRSGSGKSVLAELLACKFIMAEPTAHLAIADYKGLDFRNYSSCNNIYFHSDCEQVIDLVYNELQRRMHDCNQSTYTPIFFFFDEIANFLATYDTKQANIFKKKLQVIAAIGRAHSTHLILVNQTLHIEAIGNFRDNLGIILMGNITKEAASMGGFPTDKIMPAATIGDGNAILDGYTVKHIHVCLPKNKDKLEHYITKGLNNTFPSTDGVA